MEIIITTASTGKVREHIPEEILMKSYPCFTFVATDEDMSLHMVLNPDPVWYDEKDVRSFLLSIVPYVEAMQLDIQMTFKSGNYTPASPRKWQFQIHDGSLFRYTHGDNYSAGGRISE